MKRALTEAVVTESTAATEVCGCGVATAPGLTIEAISDVRSFLALESVWNDLVEQAEVTHPFLTHEWVRIWWECFGAGKELHILVVKAGTEVTAIAPLMLSQGRMYGLPVRQMEFIANVYTERFDVIVARRHDDTYRTIWSYLAKEKARWDVVRLCQLPVDSRTLEALPRLAQETGLLIGTWKSSDSPYIEFAGGWEAFVKQLSRNRRHQMRKKLRYLERLGQVRLEVISSGEDLETALHDGFRIEGAGWKGYSKTSIRCQPELERFLTKLAAVGSRSVMPQLFFLTVDRVRIAFSYTLRYKNKLFALKAGYDPQYASYSPYNLLCHLIFRDACERGLDEYEFLGGNEEWKLRWTKQTRSHYWLYLFTRSLRTHLLHYAKFRLVPSLRKLWSYRLWHDSVASSRRLFGYHRAN